MKIQGGKHEKNEVAFYVLYGIRIYFQPSSLQ